MGKLSTETLKLQKLNIQWNKPQTHKNELILAIKNLGIFQIIEKGNFLLIRISKNGDYLNVDKSVLKSTDIQKFECFAKLCQGRKCVKVCKWRDPV